MSIDALIAGFIAGIISPLLLSLIQHQLIWKSQKLAEARREFFGEAVKAIAMFESDALDPGLQQQPSTGGLRPVTRFREETRVQIQKSLSLVEAFFSTEASDAFQKALSTNVSLNTIPSVEFSTRRTMALKLLARDVGFLPTA